MKWLDLKGREREVTSTPYVIDWDGKSLSQFQFRVKQFLKPYWCSKYVCEEHPVVGSRMSVDFINVSDMIAVEANGRQHLEFNFHMHNGSLANYRAQLKRDLAKGEWCTRNGLKLIEIEPEDKLSPQWFWDRWQVIL